MAIIKVTAAAAAAVAAANLLSQPQAFAASRGRTTAAARTAAGVGLHRPAEVDSSAGQSSASAGLQVAAAGAMAGAALRLARSGRSARKGSARNARLSRTACAAAGSGPIETFMIQGKVDVSKLSMACAPLANEFDWNAIVFFSLGVDPQIISAVAGGALGLHGTCPVYVADCYGIVGFDKKAGSNVELMEKDRGQEYGCKGGNGGEGVVVVGFRGSHTPTVPADGSALPGDRALHMLVTTEGKPSAPPSGVIYGGVAKKCYQLEHSGDLVAVPQFAISTTGAVVSAFEGDAAEAAKAAVGKATSDPMAAGYFPCFCRGVNKYGEDGVEPGMFADSGLKDVPLFGMFAHGELGPAQGAPVVCSSEETPAPSVELHSATSVLAIYGK